MTDQQLLSELAYVKAVFQLRTIEAVIRGPAMYPAERVNRRKVHAVARQLRKEGGLKPSEVFGE